MDAETMRCPHCDGPLERWEPSPYSGWGNDLWVCNNNACQYFTKGRRKTTRDYRKNFAYRYCFNPATGRALPIVTWCHGELSLLKGRCAEP